MSNISFVPKPDNFNFRHAVAGHGWYDLSPFEYDEAGGKLTYVFSSPNSGKAVCLRIGENGSSLQVEVLSETNDVAEASEVVRHILRIDEDLSDFYLIVQNFEQFEWIGQMNAGRLLRSGSVFEDLVKTMCTTNCSWALTRSMVSNLVEELGASASNGLKAFPTPEAIASSSESFFRNDIRAGYRAPYLIELGEAVAAKKVDPERWFQSDLPTSELKLEIMKVKGIGNYAAENLLKLLGRYDGLALDSWLRAGFYKKHNRDKACADKKIEKHYRKFGNWKGLVIWCDMTRDWFH